MPLFLYLLFTLAAAMLAVPLWADLLRLSGHLEMNYRGRSIPQSMGGVYAPVFLLAAGWAGWTGLVQADLLRRAVIVVLGLGITGLVDDIWGDAKTKGFSGHFRELLFRGRVTTGLTKAFAGLAVAFWAVAGLPGHFLLIVWRAVLVALSANLMNLLDLRPGRSLKSFFLLFLFYVWLVSAESGILLLFPLVLTSLVYFPWDLSGRGMLGDAGSNVLGGALGFAVVSTAPFSFQLLYMAALVGFHLLAERVSLTRMIEANSFLRFFDELGRRGWEK